MKEAYNKTIGKIERANDTIYTYYRNTIRVAAELPYYPTINASKRHCPRSFLIGKSTESIDCINIINVVRAA